MTNDLNPAGVDAAALLDQYDSLAHDMIGALANAHAWALLAKDEPAAENQGEVMDALIWRWDALKKPKFDAVATLRSASPPQPEGETEELVPTAWQVLFKGDVRWVLNYYRPSDGEIEARPLYSADAITSLSQRLAVAEARLAVSDSRWRDTVQGHAAAMRMVIDATEELFGAVASVESEDASLLRGPEPRHRAEGGVEALQRVAARLAVMEAERDEARKVLAEHHEWHLQSGEIGLPDGEGGWIAIDNASAYSESSLYDRTAEIISTHPPELKPAPRGGVVHNWWAQWVLQGRILKTTLARADAAEAQLARAREAAIEECAKMADEHAAEWKAQAWDAVQPLQLNQVAQMQHLAAIQIATAIRAMKGGGE